jgi:hypothetical protein
MQQYVGPDLAISFVMPAWIAGMQVRRMRPETAGLETRNYFV